MAKTNIGDPYLTRRNGESNRPIEPLLLVMALEQGSAENVSSTRAQLYERYFRRLLRVENNQIAWEGWRTALEELANWFLINTGKTDRNR